MTQTSLLNAFQHQPVDTPCPGKACAGRCDALTCECPPCSCERCRRRTTRAGAKRRLRPQDFSYRAPEIPPARLFDISTTTTRRFAR